MFHIFQFGQQQPPYRRPMGGNVLLFNGLLCVFFGLAILAAPELLAFFVATILIFIGVSILTMWWKVRNMR